MMTPGYIILQVTGGIVKLTIFVAVSAIIIYLSRECLLQKDVYSIPDLKETIGPILRGIKKLGIKNPGSARKR